MEKRNLVEYQALGMQCQYCDREFGYLVLTQGSKETRIDIRRMMHDYNIIAVCRQCADTKGKISDQNFDDLRYIRTRLHE